jgi:hypothetical protein
MDDFSITFQFFGQLFYQISTNCRHCIKYSINLENVLKNVNEYIVNSTNILYNYCIKVSKCVLILFINYKLVFYTVLNV